MKTPTIRVVDATGSTHGAISTSEPGPVLPFRDESIQGVTALDILEHVQDEQTWLAEFARILVPDGALHVRVPVENLLAWADALNSYRYIADTIGRGRAPRESLPTGWHRHYAPTDLPDILRLAGFEIVEVRGEGLALGELSHLAGLVIGDALLGRRATERRLFAIRQRLGRRPRARMPMPIAAKLTVHARRVRDGYDPEPDLDRSDRPEQHATPLE